MIKKIHYTHILLFILFMIGLLTVPSYGTSWDELSERDIVRANIKEYALNLFPQDSDVYQKYAKLDIVRISESVEKDHGAATLYLAELIFSSDMSGDYKILLWHIYIYLLFFCGVLAVYYICKFLFSHLLWGILGALIYFFSPRIFAEAHYNNKDIVLLSLLLCTFAIFLSLLKKYSYKKLFAAAFAVALLINARIVGIAFFGLFAVYYLFYMIRQKEPAKIICQKVCIGLGCVIILYYILTPALWGNNFPGFIKHLIINMIRFKRWEGDVFFRGTLMNPVPRYYLPWMIMVSTPVYILLAYIVGNIILIAKLFKQKKDFFNDQRALSILVINMTCIIPLAFAIITHSKTYNGWRHFYFAYGAIVIISVYGIYEIYQLFLKKGRFIVIGIVVASLLTTCISMIINHPYQYAYYNILARRAGESYELDYWNISISNALDTLLESSDAKVMTIGACDGWTRDGLVKNLSLLDIERFQNYIYVENWPEADYIIINNTYAVIASGSEAHAQNIQHVLNTYEKVVSI